MTDKTLNDLFLHTLKDVYFAEKAILKALPKMEKAAGSAELKKAFATHREQTQGQVERLDRVFEIIGKRAQAEPCEAIQGLIKEGEEVIETFGGSEVADAGLISSAQAVEHYEIARYGALKSWADQLGMDDAAGLLAETLTEEEETDALLTRIAESATTFQAAQGRGTAKRAARV